jgi:hypothetical protein
MIMSSSIVIRNGFLETEKPRSVKRCASCPPDIVFRCRSDSTVSTQVSDDIVANEMTTVMVRNIPTRYNAVSFLALLADCGFSSFFDFFYLPMDFRTGKNMGYAFLNFTSSYYAQVFIAMFNNTPIGFSSSSKKVLDISISKRQGLVNNVELFRNSDLLSSESFTYYKPFVQVQVWVRSEWQLVLVPLTNEVFTYITNKI